MTVAMRLNARLDRELARKVDALKRRTGQSTTEVLRSALERYCDAENEPQSAREVFEETGFIGCVSGPSDLSTSYKTKLGQSLRRKLRR